MKILVTSNQTKEVEIPQYFSLYGSVGKVLNEKHYLNVRPIEYSEHDYPSIQVHFLSPLGIHVEHVKEISKEEFTLAFMKAEKMLNELRS